MAPTIKTKLANPGNYGAERPLSSIRYIVLHYTGNDGDSDEANANYFANNVVKTSAHYFVDDNSITQSVPDNRVAWHCGAKTYFHADARNFNSIGVELCDNKRDGQIVPSQATIDRALELVRWLMKNYSVPAENVIRHWDVSHKLCPAFWCGSAAKDALWKSQFWDKLTEKKEEKEEVLSYEQFLAYMIRYEAEQRTKTADSYAVDSCRKAITSGRFSDGTGDGSLDYPQAPLKRQEFATVLDRLGLLD